MCINYMRLAEDIQVLNNFADAYHWDIMDGHYVPSLALNLDMLAALREYLTKPSHAHLMVQRPQDYVPRLLDLGVEEISLHLDTVQGQFFRLKNLIKQAGAKVGIVLNPLDSPAALEYVLEELDSVTVMTVDPGFASQPFIPAMVRIVAQLQEWKVKHGLGYEIEVDGSINQRTMPTLREAGAERFVLGSTGLFGLSSSLEEAVALAREYIVPLHNGGSNL